MGTESLGALVSLLPMSPAPKGCRRSHKINFVFWPEAGLNVSGKAGVRAHGWAERALSIRRKVGYGFQSLSGSGLPAAAVGRDVAP